MLFNAIFYATLVALVFVFVFWAFGRVLLTGTAKRMTNYIIGADGRASTSKFQFYVFTFAFLFVFVLISTFLYIATGHFVMISDIPPHVLTAMGFSSITFVGAKAITTTQISAGKVVKAGLSADAASTNSPWMYLVTDDDGNLDLGKFQMLIWTLLAVIIFIIGAYQIICNLLPPGAVHVKVLINIPAQKGDGDHSGLLPDINEALMVLMGLGQGTYLGHKLVLSSAPRLTGIAVTKAAVAPDVNPVLTITGGDFGEKPNGSQILIDGKPLAIVIPDENWARDSITFDPGKNQPDGTPFTKGQLVNIGVIIGGIRSSNTLPFAF